MYGTDISVLIHFSNGKLLEAMLVDCRRVTISMQQASE
jgi:hypothetical protein